MEGVLLSGSWDETARGWDLETGECKWVLGGHEVMEAFSFFLQRKIHVDGDDVAFFSFSLFLPFLFQIIVSSHTRGQ